VRTHKLAFAACFAAALAGDLFAQDGAALQKHLISEYPLTQPTADLTDIVKSGAQVGLQKGPLVMVNITNPTNVCTNTYKNGKLNQSFLCKPLKLPGADGTVQSRTFVSGEKIWVTQILVKNDEVMFALLSDSFNDSRFKGVVHLPFPSKTAIPPDAEVDRIVAEVFQVADGTQRVSPAKGPSNDLDVPPPAPDVPAPVPAQQPGNVSIGQTPEQVTAILGKPIATLNQGPTQQTYVYKQIKVIFENGKVSDFQ
jgi:hypothetical protein